MVARFWLGSFAAFALALSSQVFSESLNVYVFLDEAPVSGVEVLLNGKSLGETDDEGGLHGDISAGNQSFVLSRGTRILVEEAFDTTDSQDVEIRVNLEADEGTDVEVAKFISGVDASFGQVAGNVQTLNGEPIVGAEVLVLNTQNNSVTTDEQGRFLLSAPRGLHNIEVRHPTYNSRTIYDFSVLATVGRSISVTLRSPETVSGINAPQIDSPIEEVLILGSFNSAQDNAYTLERYATGIVDAIDIEQISRFGDSTLASALKRVAGVAILDGKYVNVRGLDGRYIVSTLNGLPMPSTDPMRRDVQLDLFPSHILSTIAIQKSYEANLPGTATGASVKIDTQSAPNERIAKASLSLGYGDGVTGEEVVAYRSSSTDWMGFDGGRRGLSDLVLDATNQGQSINICSRDLDPSCVEPLEAAALALTFEDDYAVRRKEASPEVSLSLAYGDVLDAEFGAFRFYGAAGYKHETSNRQDAELNDTLSETGRYERARETISANAYLALGLDFRQEDKIDSKSIFLRNTDDTTLAAVGIDDEDRDFSEVILEWVERQFISQQFIGEHHFSIADENHVLDWQVGYANTDRYEPDRRTYVYLNGNLSNSSVERRWSELDEDSYDMTLNYTAPVRFSSSVLTEFKVGVLGSDKSREVDLYRFGLGLGPNAPDIDFSNPDVEAILSYENYVRDRIRLSVRTTPTDSYESDEEVIAGYLQASTEIGEQWIFDVGVRQESFEQCLRYPNEVLTTQPQIDRRTALECLESDESLPFVTAGFNPTDAWQFRLGASRTVSYPGIVERSESFSFDPDNDDPIVGNPELVVSTIDNADLRAEYYFSDEEFVSLAVFAKHIQDPIERAIPEASGRARAITFRNAEEADLQGVEIDFYTFILNRENLILFASGNLAWIDSEVTLDEDSLRLEGASAQGRELQGQAPWLANLQLGLDHYPTEQKFTFLVNYFDDRIYRIARGADVGPEIELGRATVDFNYEKLFGESLTLKASVKNILDEEMAWEQNNQVIESFTEGVRFSIGASYEF